MEIIVEIIVQALGEICCQVLFTAAVDALFGVAAVKVHKARAREEATGEPSKSDLWSWMFWILLPFVIGLTGLLIYTIARRSAG